jgi:two-component system response regulator RegA
MSLVAPQPTEHKVLIVDPDPRSAHDLAAALRREGYVTLEASTFPDGKRLWNKELPEALVADVKLGQFNGLQLLVRAKLERPDVAGIIICALPDVVLEAETRRFGGIFLLKPLDLAHVVHLLRSHTERQALIRTGNHADRRVWERRKTAIAGFVPERREIDRRAGQGKQDRRIEDRRQMHVPNVPHDRRVADRRARGRPS